MKKLKLSTLIDATFIFFSSFFVFYAILKVFIKKIVTTTIITLIISAILTFLFMVYDNSKKERKDFLYQDENKFLAFKTYLMLLSSENAMNLVYSYYDKKYQKLGVKNGEIYIYDINAYVIFDFISPKKDLSSILKEYKNLDNKHQVIFISFDFDSEIYSFITENNLDIKLIKTREFYCLLKEDSLLPNLEVKKELKLNLKSVFSNFLKRENSKKFLLWGGLSLILSTFTYYRFLYVIIGILLVGLSLYLRFFIKESKG